MPRIFLILLIFLPLTTTAANSSFYVYTVVQDSWVSIEGTTNVNSFRCNAGNDMSGGLLNANYDLDKDAVYFSNASMVLPISSFDCGNRRMNRDFIEALGGTKHPDIEVILLETQANGSPGDQANSVIATVEIIINGTSNENEVPAIVTATDQFTFHVRGVVTLKMSDFNIDPPSPALGLVKVDDSMDVTFNLTVNANILSDF